MFIMETCIVAADDGQSGVIDSFVHVDLQHTSTRDMRSFNHASCIIDGPLLLEVNIASGE